MNNDIDIIRIIQKSFCEKITDKEIEEIIETADKFVSR